MSNDPAQPGTLRTQPSLLEANECSDIMVNQRCMIYESAGARMVMINGVLAHHYHVDDRVAEDLVLAQIQLAGHASSRELATALGRSASTIQRCRRRYEAEGAEGLIPKKRGPPPGQRLGAARLAAIRRWHSKGISGREIARRLKVAPGTVQKALRRQGLAPLKRGGDQRSLQFATGDGVLGEGEDCNGAAIDAIAGMPQEEEEVSGTDGAVDVRSSSGGGSGLAEEAVTEDVVEEDAAGLGSLCNDPWDRSMDRWFASVGRLDDAVPMFAPQTEQSGAGVLLALPLLVRSGLFDVGSQVLGSIGPAFYGLRTSLLVFILFALLRIKHPENIKEYNPQFLGRIIGLDRVPEVKTLRRKLTVIAEKPVDEFLAGLLRRRVDTHGDALGFLYVDGHVRAYHGKAPLQKTHVARLGMYLPATQEVWVNDAKGDPLFFVTQQAHPSLVSALPQVLADAREELGNRRVTVVFDRGGWSPKMFEALVEGGHDIVTYRKGSVAPVSAELFRSYPVPKGRKGQTWVLADTQVQINKKLSMRQITRLTGEHQTHIVTTRDDLDASTIAQRMFGRWRQENFFKYMRQEYAIDALVEYGHDPDRSGRDVPSPKWSSINADFRKARAEVQRLAAIYGEAAIDNPEAKRPTMRGFKIAHGTKIGTPLREARSKLAELEQQRASTPRRVAVQDLDKPYVQLKSRRKRLSDGLKMLAYQVETDLVRAVEPFYPRSLDEGRTLISAALQSTAQILCDGQTLHVRLAPQSSPHRSRAIQELCTILNATETSFPGTNLTLRYSVCVNGE